MNWPMRRLGELGRLYCGQSPPSSAVNGAGRGTPYVTGPDQWDGVRLHLDKWTTSPKRVVPDGCVFVTVKGAGVGTIFPGQACAIGRDVYAYEPSTGLDRRFVEYALRSSVLDVLQKARGTIPGLTREHLTDHEIPVPSIHEQRRIVAKLDAQLAQTRAAREQLEAVPALVEQYRQSVLAAAFRGDLTADWRKKNPEAGVDAAWPHVALEQLLDDGPSNGLSPRSTGKAAGPLALKLTATTSGALRLDDAAVKQLDEPVPPDARAWLEPGDLLVQRANTLEYLGAAAIFDGPARTYVYPDLMMRIRIGDPITRRYVWRFLNSPMARRYFRANATGTAGNMPKITGAVLRRLPVPLAPSDLQEEIVEKLDAVWASSGVSLEVGRTAADDIRAVERTLLARAFLA